jgi:hypothetical protein
LPALAFKPLNFQSIFPCLHAAEGEALGQGIRQADAKK